MSKEETNFYRPHPLMINSGQFWRCSHGTTGLKEGLEAIGCHQCAMEEIKRLEEKCKETAKDFELAFRLVRKENDELRAQIHDMCHNKHTTGPVTPEEFCKGCEAFQVQLFGHSPITALREQAKL